LDVTGSLKALDVAGAGVLRIDSVQLSDSGVYVCMWNWNTTTVDDELGVAYLNLTVIGMYRSLHQTDYTSPFPGVAHWASL